MSGDNDTEGAVKKLPYPKSVFFIIICEFCERFCYYGMRTVLTLYFVQVLSMTDDSATVIYHLYVMVSYFTPLIGAMLADSLLGKFQTIFYLGVVYCAGCVVLALAATPPISLPTTAFSMIGLALIALGTGGIKPCVSAFGADQFKLPEQEIQVASYFAVFYFAINSGSLVSTILTPILREDIKCFDNDHCYSVAFAVPGALMIFALLVFIVGRPMYNVKKPEGNVVIKVIGAIKYALSHKGKEIKAGRQRDHWMDYAEDKYGHRFVAEAKVLLKVLFLYIPLPLFWALFDQQGSRWTLQATRMDGNTWGWVIKPDQLQVVNPLLVLAFIPIFDQGIYPLLAKFGVLKKPLQRLTVGGIFAGVAFAVSGFVELSLEPTYATELKAGETNFHIINGVPDCGINFALPSDDVAKFIKENDFAVYEAIQAKKYSVKVTSANPEKDECSFGESSFDLEGESETAFSVIIYQKRDKSIGLVRIDDPDDMEKSDSGNPKMRVVYIPGELDSEHKLLEGTMIQGHSDKHVFDFDLANNVGYTPFGETEPTEFELYMSNVGVPQGFKFNDTKADMKLGAVYVMSVMRTGNVIPDIEANYEIGFHQITKANNVHMLLLIPQYLIMTMGEIMFSITIMDFSYAEGPPSMKSVMQSAWLMTVAFGNLIVVIIAELKIFDKQWKEFFLFAGLMFADMILFAYMAYKYEPADRFWLKDDEEKDKQEKEGESERKQSKLSIAPSEAGNDNSAFNDKE